jgi:2-methylcitrate dehydratase PrpD
MDDNAFDAEAIASVDVVIFPHALKIAGVEWPTRPSEAPFCLRYVVATLLSTGRLGIEDMESPAFEAPALRRLAERIRVGTDDAFQRVFPQRRPSRVTITLRDGRCFSALRDLRRGDPEDPFDWAQLQTRMRAFAPAMDDEAALGVTRWCERFADPACDAEPCRPAAAPFGAG